MDRDSAVRSCAASRTLYPSDWDGHLPRHVKCDICDRLQAALESVSAVYRAAAAEAVRHLGTSLGQRASVTEQLQHALAEVARARIALKTHEQEHRC
jgi:hypothetical protein